MAIIFTTCEADPDYIPPPRDRHRCRLRRQRDRRTGRCPQSNEERRHDLDRMSAVGGKADFDLERLEVCL